MKDLVTALHKALLFSMATAHKFQVITYYASWTGVQPAAVLQSPAVQKHDMINFSFLDVKPDGTVVFQDETRDGKLAQDWVAARGQNNSLKLAFSLGGYTFSSGFSDAAANPVSRVTLANSIKDLLVKYQFDGVDIDWEFPGIDRGDGTPFKEDDPANFVLLLQEIRNVIGVDKTIAIALSSGPDKINALGNNIAKLNGVVDHLLIMTYDYSGSWSDTIRHTSNLFRPVEDPTSLSINDAINLYIGKGVSKEKLLIGIPLYGRGFYVDSSGPISEHGIFSRNLRDLSRFPSNSDAFTYQQIQQTIQESNGDMKQYYDDKAVAAWAYNKKSGLVISMDTSDTIRAKVIYAKRIGLGGLFSYEITQGNEHLLNAMMNATKEQ